MKLAIASLVSGLIAVLALIPAASSRPSVAAPRLLGTQSAPAQSRLPTFAWTAVRGVDHYEFQIAADARFNSPILGSVGHFTTRNTRATVSKTPPNGRYWWRVRAVTKGGAVSRWSTGSLNKRWNVSPTLLSPGSAAGIDYPTDPLVLSWSSVTGASEYEVDLATEPRFATQVRGAPMKTSATSIAPPSALAAGTYYWRVTPLDPEGNEGKTSAVRSFTWRWPTKTVTRVSDLVDAPEFSDPQFAWDRVPGAAAYELDVNFSQDFAPGSRVCCTKPTIASAYSPTQVLDNNTYYWRVRAIDPHGNQGVWVEGQPFTKTFDNVPPVSGTSIRGLHVRDNVSDSGSSPLGYATSSPIVVWDPVPGAASYEVNVAPLISGSCEWSSNTKNRWDVTTGVTAWTPLGSGGTPPYPARDVTMSEDTVPALVPGWHYCVRVRAQSDTGSKGRIYGDFTYLTDAFAFTAYPTGSTSAPPISAGDYYGPRTLQGSTPLLTWRAIPGAASYWVIVSRDASFTTLVDYGFTREPAYAPRASAAPRTYADETTAYYWAVLPSGSPTGTTAVVGDPHLASPVSFDKRSTPPAQISPAAGAVVGAEQPIFHWTPVLGARNYNLQVSSDPTFASGMLDDVTTDSTAFTGDTTYPPGKKLYWRVRASDENKIGLTWSETRSFEHELPVPAPLATNARSGDLVPVWRWAPAAGAVGYDLHAVLPDGKSRDFRGIPSPAWAAGEIAGLGVFRWSVRAAYPKASGTTPGPYSNPAAFTRTLHAPAGAHAQIAQRGIVFTWRPRPGARSYRVEVSRSPDFGRVVDSAQTEASAYAPSLTQTEYAKGGRFYWHVAAIDSRGNQGNFSPTLVTRLRRLPQHR